MTLEKILKKYFLNYGELIDLLYNIEFLTGIKVNDIITELDSIDSSN